MLELRPFQAVRYAARDLSAVVAPPYDVLDQTDKDALLARSADNVVAIDLPHLPPKSAGPAEVYEAAARRLRQWLESAVLVRDAKDALYVYHQRFLHEGREHVRRMFVARLRLQPFSQGSILPHEQTFGGPKEDRLALMKATACQLSPIFGLYADPGDEIGPAFAATTRRPPAAVATLDGVENRLWVEYARDTIDSVASFMADKKVYIADGHHRYGTALMYRDWLAERAGDRLRDGHPANFIMFVLASMDDPGCLILPYNRVLGGVNAETVLDAWSPGIRRVAQAGAATTPHLAEGGPGGVDLVLYDGRSRVETAVQFTNRPALRRLAPDQVEPWYDLDYAYLHRYLIDELLAGRPGRTLEVHYVKSADQARETAGQCQGVALLTRSTPMGHLRAVSEAGGLMPQKSTYFHPKLATGLTLHPLA